MIVVKLMGGLGNQMFQYAFGQQLQFQYHEPICYDLDSYKTDFQRTPVLQNFLTETLPDWNAMMTPSQIRQIRLREKQYHVTQKVVRVLRHSDQIGEKLFQKCSSKGCYFNFDPFYYPVLSTKAPTKVAYGYFQGVDYFSNVQESVRQQFSLVDKPTPKEAALLHKIASENSVAIHIRCGDYTKSKNKRFQVCTPAYFQEAVQYLKQHVPSPHWYVFTNDAEMVRQKYALPKDAILVNGYSTSQDFRFMTACQHFIISNSTFSWWASFLAENQDKIVVVPKRWRSTQRKEPAIYRSGMVKL